jgi:hypothetical protein
MNFCAAGGTRQKSLITSYVKDLTLYDIHSGILVIFCFFLDIALVKIYIFGEPRYVLTFFFCNTVFAGLALAGVW